MDNAAAPTGPEDQQSRNSALQSASHSASEPTRNPVPSDTPAPRRRRMGVLLAVAATAYVLDVVSKIIVVAKLSDRGPVHVLGSFLQLTYTRNPGAAFSLGVGYTVVFSIIAVGVVVVIARLSRSLYSTPWAIALGLLLGGALGNLTDRIVRSPGVFRGWVVDFIQFPHFAIFNLADSAISVGGVLMVLLAFRGLHPDGTDERAAPRPDHTDERAAPRPDGTGDRAAEPSEQGAGEPSASEAEPAADKVEK